MMDSIGFVTVVGVGAGAVGVQYSVGLTFTILRVT
jgi:hypothetical protein